MVIIQYKARLQDDLSLYCFGCSSRTRLFIDNEKLGCIFLSKSIITSLDFKKVLKTKNFASGTWVYNGMSFCCDELDISYNRYNRS
jgi:hypothetical protein